MAETRRDVRSVLQGGRCPAGPRHWQADRAGGPGPGDQRGHLGNWVNLDKRRRGARPGRWMRMSGRSWPRCARRTPTCAPVLHMASRRVRGFFALSEHHDAELAYDALAMAVAVRGGHMPRVILHTDQGSEYGARAFRAACVRLSITQSMGRPGSALDSAVIESLPWTRGSGSRPPLSPRRCARSTRCPGSTWPPRTRSWCPGRNTRPGEGIGGQEERQELHRPRQPLPGPDPGNAAAPAGKTDTFLVEPVLTFGSKRQRRQHHRRYHDRQRTSPLPKV